MSMFFADIIQTGEVFKIQKDAEGVQMAGVWLNKRIQAQIPHFLGK